MYGRTGTVEHSAAHLSRTVHCLCKGVPLEAVTTVTDVFKAYSRSVAMYKMVAPAHSHPAPQSSTKIEDTAKMTGSKMDLVCCEPPFLWMTRC